MLRRIFSTLIVFPLAALVVALAVANRHSATFILDPFNREDPAISLDLPMYAYILTALIAGVVLGGFATWLAQSQWRRAARQRGQEAKRWHAEADRLIRERDTTQPPEKRLAAAGR